MKYMLSRVADSVYWMSRYIERAENVARFVDVNQQLLLDQPDAEDTQWAPLVAITGDTELFEERYGAPTRASVVRFLLFDREYGNSVVTCLRSARENARGVREIISREMWEELNRAYLLVTDAARNPDRVVEDPDEFLRAVKDACHQFVGTMLVTMTHNDAWNFMRMGRVLERADKTSRIVDVKYFTLLPTPADVGTPIDELQWAGLLRSASALEMYRKRYGRISPQRVVEFLLLDPKFPRAAHYCVHLAEASLHAITGGRPGAASNPAERHIGRLRAELEYAEVEDIVQVGLHEWVDAFQTKLNKVGDAVHDTFFALDPVGAGAASDEQ
ncbi:MAG: alpha-E domain-containing protein [Myxococcales bacterium]|nr:alpha-E domain-containing protein [Myxococcales bacterium]